MVSLVGVYAIGWIFLLMLGALWFFLPFAVFGTQPKIQKLLAVAKRTNELLAQIKADMDKRNSK